MQRREFLAGAMVLALAPSIAYSTRSEASGFFRLSKDKGRWLLLDPTGKPFFSIGLNHIDPAGLRYPENGHIWRDKYGNSMQRWLTEAVRPHLLDWGFNTVGWTQEVITRGLTHHRHSRRFTRQEYDWLDMPYCHQLPFAEFHQWEAETRHPDFFSAEFADWCDHVAREHCATLADDPRLIGYFYVDCPTWVHTRVENEWKGPLFDPADLETESGRKELHRLATQWYKVTHDAIRRYDPNHLILGDRYEANAPLPLEVVEAARPFIDVLSFQDFHEPVAHLADWHQKTGMPVLWADGSHGVRLDNGYRRNDGAWWAATLPQLAANPGCIGAHLCGAYLANRIRKKGLLDESEKPDEEMIGQIRKANRALAEQVAGL